MRVFIWHVHGSYMTALVQGGHQYLVPTLPSRSAWGRGRARTWDWPESVVEVSPAEAPSSDVDVVVLQRPEELDHLAEAWLGRRPGHDLPAVYLEHNVPQGQVQGMMHPAADHPGVIVVHVTMFNALMWDNGAAPCRVIEHGLIDPGYRYTGELERAAVVVNEPVRRGRVTGTDLVRPLSRGSGVPVDLFGMASAALGGRDLAQAELHAEMARRRVYLHPMRWTSLGLSLLEAMCLGMPVVALATTEAPRAVPRDAGVVSNDPAVLADALRRIASDRDEAESRGRVARAAVLDRYGLERFLRDWDEVLAEATT